MFIIMSNNEMTQQQEAANSQQTITTNDAELNDDTNDRPPLYSELVLSKEQIIPSSNQ